MLTKFVKINNIKMDNFGDIIRRLRLDKGMPLRKVAAYLDIDQAILSKIERGQRKATRRMVVKLAEYHRIDVNELLVAWLSDSIVYQLKDEETAIKSLLAAEEKVLYSRKVKSDHAGIINIITDFLKKDGRIAKAWVFGSFARGEESPLSDIDLMVSYSEKASGTLLDYADIRYKLETLLNRNVDLVEEGYAKSFAAESINQDKVLIYG